MGYSLAWLAIRGKPREVVLEKLGLRGTGKREDFAESEITCAELPGGWFLIVSNIEERVAETQLLGVLTAGAEAVECFIEEHVMVSSAAGWKDGRKAWSIVHNCENKMRPLETEGELPGFFASIRDELTSKQAAADAAKRDVDYIFDVPVEVAGRITGYRHDEDIPELGKDAFEVLAKERTASGESGERKSWWKFW